MPLKFSNNNKVLSVLLLIMLDAFASLKCLKNASIKLPPNDRNIVGRNMLRLFGHPVATCCDMLGIESRTSAHARVQHCCTNMAKRRQHHATSTNVATLCSDSCLYPS